MSRISLRLIANSLTLVATIGSAAAKPPDTPEPAAGPPPLQPRLHRPAPRLPCPPRGHHRGPAFLEQSPAPLQPDQIRTVMSFCRQHFGGLHRRLEELRESNPRNYKRLLRRLAPRLLWMQAVYRRRPDLGKLLILDQKLEHQIRQQARLYRRAEAPDKRHALRQRLTDLLQRQFDVRLKRKQLELQDLERRLDEQRARLHRYAQSRQHQIRRRLQRLLSDRSVGPRQTQDRPATPSHR